MIKSLSMCLMLVGYCGVVNADSRDYIAEMTAIQDETQRVAYVRSLSTNEIWLLVDQVRDKQGRWHSYGAGVILSFYFGENWERITPQREDFTRIICDKRLNAEMRGALAASGFELGRRWEIYDRLQYFESAQSLLSDSEIPDEERIHIAEYSYRAFSRCLSEVRSLSDTNAMKSVLLNACHSRAQGMIKTLSSVVEEGPKEHAYGTMANALEDYVNAYEHPDFPESSQLQEAVAEAAKARSLLRQYRKD